MKYVDKRKIQKIEDFRQLVFSAADRFGDPGRIPRKQLVVSRRPQEAHHPEDIVLAQPTANPAEAQEVWTGRRDPYFHADANCENILVPAVKIQRATALEFEKMPCPACEEGNK